MIEYNKYTVLNSQKISSNRAIQKTTHTRAQRYKLTTENKQFLKLLGLLK